MNVCMLVKNSFEYDARVTKEARTLIEAGHDVTVVAIHVPNVTAEEETLDSGIHVIRVSRMQFGLPTLNRIARRYVGFVERRRSRLVGEPVDEDLIEELGTFHVASTATPGDAGVDHERASRTASATSMTPAPPRSLRRRWADFTTGLLRAFARFARFGFKMVKGLLGRQGRAAKTYAINKRFIKAALSTHPDVVHAHDLNTLWVGTEVKKRIGAKLVYDSHELATARNRMGFWWRKWARYWERRGIPSADAVIMAAPGYAAAAMRLYDGIEEPTVILNVPELTIPEREGFNLREELDLPRDKHLVVYQGSIQQNRGIEQVIAAMEHVPDTVMVVIGYGYHRSALEAMVRDRGWTGRVRFFGPVPNDELISWTASADLGVCCIVGTSPSYFHSLPNKLFEYLMAGVPVIASDFPGMGGITKDADVGEVADPEDPQSIAAAMRRVLEDEEARERYERNAKVAVERYNWGVEAERLVALYRDLGRPGPSA